MATPARDNRNKDFREDAGAEPGGETAGRDAGAEAGDAPEPSTDDRPHSRMFRRDAEQGAPPSEAESVGAPAEPAGPRGSRSGKRSRKRSERANGSGAGTRKRRGPRPWVWALVGLAVLLLVAGGLAFWLIERGYETTDDAFVDGHVARLSPRVAGKVLRVLVDDNQQVEAGQVLVELDPADFQAALENARAAQAQAEGRLGEARTRVGVADANVAEARANVTATGADVERLAADYQRYQQAGMPAVSAQQIETARQMLRAAQAQLDASKRRVAALESAAQLARDQVKTSEATVRAAQATTAQAELNLKYTEIAADVPGRATARAVEPGNYVTPGQQLMAIVTDPLFVTANFRESQITDMRVGQPVSVRVDAFPDERLRAHVDSFQKGTGAAFSLLPPENATGNYVKVVQRVPVKIVFDEPIEKLRKLGVGMSVEPRVRVRGGQEEVADRGTRR